MKKVFAFAAAALLSICAFAQNSIKDRIIEDEPLYSNRLIDFDLISQIGMGFNYVLSDDAALKMNLLKSFSFSIDLAYLDFNLTSNGAIQLHSALRWTFDNYSSKEGYIYQSKLIPGTISAIPGGSDVKKSKMRTDYLGIPVGIKVKAGDVCIFANALGEYNTKAISKVKYKGSDKEKDVLGGCSEIRHAVEAGIAFDDVAIFCKYTLSPTFEKTTLANPENGIITAGIILGF